MFDPATYSWAKGPVLPVAKGRGTAATLGDDLYYVSGYNEYMLGVPETLRMTPGGVTTWYVHTRD